MQVQIVLAQRFTMVRHIKHGGGVRCIRFLQPLNGLAEKVIGVENGVVKRIDHLLS